MKTHRSSRGSAGVHLGFQIAPMVDVVFVVLLFFMVLAGSVKTERHHTMFLPVHGDPVQFLDEVQIRIEGDGQVYLNEDPLDKAGSRGLPELTATLQDLRQNSDAAKSQLYVVLSADTDATCQRVVDAMSALSTAGIERVTFEAADPG